MEVCGLLQRQCSLFPGLKAAFLQAEGVALLLELLEDRSLKVRDGSHSPALSAVDQPCLTALGFLRL